MRLINVIKSNSINHPMRTALQHSSSAKTHEIEIECDRPPIETKFTAKKLPAHAPKGKLTRKISKIKAPANANFFDWRTLNWSMTLSSKSGR